VNRRGPGRGKRVTRPPIASRRDASSAPQRSTAALSVLRLEAGQRFAVSSSHSRSARQKSRRRIIVSMFVALVLASTISAERRRIRGQSLLYALRGFAVRASSSLPATTRPGSRLRRDRLSLAAARAAGLRAAAGDEGAGELTPQKPRSGCRFFPGAQFITSYDAGRGQRYYIFGTAGVVCRTRGLLSDRAQQKGELVYEVPATHEFDVGKYREETMGFRGRDESRTSVGDLARDIPILNRGRTACKISTLIQIVPVTER